MTYELIQTLFPTGDSIYLNFGWGVAISGNWLVSYTSEYYNDREMVYFFENIDNTWTFKQKIITTTERHNSWTWGKMVDIFGNTCIAGNSYDNTLGYDVGAAYIYTLDENTNTWSKTQTLFASDASNYAHFGNSVSIDGDYCLIIASGGGYIFKNEGGTWIEKQKLVNDDYLVYGTTFTGCDIDNNTCIIGSLIDDEIEFRSGAVYVFTKNGETWSQQQKIKQDNPERFGFFGERQIVIKNDLCFVGWTAYNSYTGMVYVFERNGESWSQKQELIASDGARNDEFGWALAVKDNICVISSIGSNGGKGSVYEFEYSGGTWAQKEKIELNEEVWLGGRSLCYDGSYLGVGDPNYSTYDYDNVGAVFIYVPPPPPPPVPFPPYLANIFPAESSFDVDISTNITFDILETVYGVNLTTVKIYINEKLAYDGNLDSFLYPFNGSLSSVSSITNGYSFVIDNVNLYEYTSIATIRVIAEAIIPESE